MMRWHYKVRGTHTHVRVFVQGALAGALVFRNEEFNSIAEAETERRAAGLKPLIEFVEEE